MEFNVVTEIFHTYAMNVTWVKSQLGLSCYMTCMTMTGVSCMISAVINDRVVSTVMNECLVWMMILGRMSNIDEC